jgi:hypothetical protein
MNVFADWVAKQWKGLNILRPCNRKNPPAMEGLKVSLWNITDGGRWELTWIKPCSPQKWLSFAYCMGWSSPGNGLTHPSHQFLRSGARLQGEQTQRWKHLARWTVETQRGFCATYVHHPSANGWLADLHSKQRKKKYLCKNHVNTLTIAKKSGVIQPPPAVQVPFCKTSSGWSAVREFHVWM